MSLCPCGSEREYQACCGVQHTGEQPAATAEALMRARYSAFVRQAFGFLSDSLHPDHRADHDAAATRRWAERAEWLGLEIVSQQGGEGADEQGEVEFIATYKENGVVRQHHETSRFQRHDGAWYYVDGQPVAVQTQVNSAPKVGRNEPCPCGSGKKYKRCCGA